MAQNNNSPGAILQSEWIRLLNECSLYYSRGLYYKSWTILQDLQSSIPKQTYIDTLKKFGEIEKELIRIQKQKFYTHIQAERQKILQENNYLRKEILLLKREIHDSLETLGWISKTTGYGGFDANAELTEL